MEALGLVLLCGFGGVGSLGLVLAWQGWKTLRDDWLLRRRGVWVHGVIERQTTAAGSFGVYRFLDADGRTRIANTTGSRAPRVSAVEVELCYDPLGKARVRHGTHLFSRKVAAVASVVLGGLWAVVVGWGIVAVILHPPHLR